MVVIVKLSATLMKKPPKQTRHKVKALRRARSCYETPLVRTGLGKTSYRRFIGGTSQIAMPPYVRIRIRNVLFDPYKKYIQSNNETILDQGTPIKTSLVANIRAAYYIINNFFFISQAKNT